MRQLFIAILILKSLTAFAQSCPRLEGVFHCRVNPAFDLRIRDIVQNGAASYAMMDPTGTREIVPDGQFHEMNFSNGKGQYRAHCEANQLLIEAHAPNGQVDYDRMYIERAAIVRIRLSANRAPSSLSCAPIEGTWRLYQSR